MTRRGKIARLPQHLRQQVNLRLHDGEMAKSIADWLNSLSEVQGILTAHFHGQPINEVNLSHWKTGGYRDWQEQQQTLEAVGRLAGATNATAHATQISRSPGYGGRAQAPRSALHGAGPRALHSPDKSRNSHDKCPGSHDNSRSSRQSGQDEAHHALTASEPRKPQPIAPQPVTQNTASAPANPGQAPSSMVKANQSCKSGSDMTQTDRIARLPASIAPLSALPPFDHASDGPDASALRERGRVFDITDVSGHIGAT